MNVLLVGGIHSGAFLSAVVLLASSAWLTGGSSRFAAVLAGRTHRQIERATGIGFFVGVALALLILTIDLLA